MKRLWVLGILVLAACATMQPVDYRAKAAEFASAASHGNAEGMVAFYADDAVLMPPGAPAMRGKDAIRQFWTGFTGMGAIDAVLTTDDVMESGNLAVESGRFELSITPKGGGAAIKDSGKYIVVWRDGKIVRDIFNSNVH